MIRHIEVLEDGITNDSGVLLASGTVKSFIGGTTTLKTLFQDFDLKIPHPNPLTLDAAGRVTAYHDGRTKLVISDSAGALVRTVDNVGTEDDDVASAAATIAGDGLIRVPNTNQIDFNPDQSSITIVNDKAQIKDGGVTGVKFNANAVDDSTINIASNKLQVKDLGITRPKQAALGEQVSSALVGVFANATAVWLDVTNLVVTITTTGRPVFLTLISQSTTSAGFIGVSGTDPVTGANFRYLRDAVVVSLQRPFVGGATGVSMPLGSMTAIDVVVAGTYIYKLQAIGDGADSANVRDAKLLAFEL